MKRNLNHFAGFLVANDFWVFLVALLLFNHGLAQATGRPTLAIYVGLAAGLCTVFAPVLLFAALRERITKWWGVQAYRIAWALVFMLFPLVLFFAQLTINQLPFTDTPLEAHSATNRYGVILVAIGLSGLALLLTLQHSWSFRWRAWLRFRPSALLTAGLLAFGLSILALMSNNLFQEVNQELQGREKLMHTASCLGQLMLIILPYYLVYLLHQQVLFRRFLRQKGLLHYLAGAVGVTLFFTPIHTLLVRNLQVVSDYKLHTSGFEPAIFVDLHYGLTATVFLISFPIILINEWYQKNSAIQLLEQEKTTAQLALLKQQINPHFFFNTLNNLYAMSITRDKATPETIMQLSELMRYVIYRGKEDQVRLREEVNYLKGYLELQRIRLQKEVDFHLAVDLEETEKMVPPLLFIVLVENAFKHGIEPAEAPAYLHLSLSSTANSITFTCNNSVEAKPDPNEAGPGIGLENLRQRLALLFPGRHKLEIQATGSAYWVSLRMEA